MGQFIKKMNIFFEKKYSQLSLFQFVRHASYFLIPNFQNQKGSSEAKNYFFFQKYIELSNSHCLFQKLKRYKLLYFRISYNNSQKKQTNMEKIGIQRGKQSSGKWKKTESDRFFKGLEKYGRNWVKVQKFVKTRTLAQVRSHAQKVFMAMNDRQRKLFQEIEARRQTDFCQPKTMGAPSERTKTFKQNITMKEKVKKLSKDVEINLLEGLGVREEDGFSSKSQESNKQFEKKEKKIFSQTSIDYGSHIPLYNFSHYQNIYQVGNQLNVFTVPLIINPFVVHEPILYQNQQNNIKTSS